MNGTDKQPFFLGYIPGLDGMRGLAILAVMAIHAGAPLSGGFIGVDIFFVLSGFLITTILVREHDITGHISLKHFYLRRILRLAPALILMLMVFSAFSIVLLHGAELRRNLTQVLIVVCYATNWARGLHLYTMGSVRHTWSLSVEEQFYMLWPLILLCLLRFVKSRRSVVSIISLLALLSWTLRAFMATNGADGWRLTVGLDTRADALLVGCALGVALTSNLVSGALRAALEATSKYFAFVSALALLCIACVVEQREMSLFYWVYAVIEVLAALIILDVVMSKGGIVKAVLSNRLLVWIGSISYGLYLWHFPIYMAMRSLKYTHWHILITVGSAATFLVAAGSYYFLERPFLKLKHKVAAITATEMPGSAENPPLPTALS
jgi:peptidoglycan/LPS O-acetylase OafA/YrhL